MYRCHHSAIVTDEDTSQVCELCGLVLQEPPLSNVLPASSVYRESSFNVKGSFVDLSSYKDVLLRRSLEGVLTALNISGHRELIQTCLHIVNENQKITGVLGRYLLAMGVVYHKVRSDNLPISLEQLCYAAQIKMSKVLQVYQEHLASVLPPLPASSASAFLEKLLSLTNRLDLLPLSIQIMALVKEALECGRKPEQLAAAVCAMSQEVTDDIRLTQKQLRKLFETLGVTHDTSYDRLLEVKRTLVSVAKGHFPFDIDIRSVHSYTKQIIRVCSTLLPERIVHPAFQSSKAAMMDKLALIKRARQRLSGTALSPISDELELFIERYLLLGLSDDEICNLLT